MAMSPSDGGIDQLLRAGLTHEVAAESVVGAAYAGSCDWLSETDGGFRGASLGYCFWTRL